MARTLQSLGRRYVRYVNDTHHRSGTLWEGRYRASLVGDGDYLRHCHRYIELNPLRAAMVADPRDHRWSSHHALAYGDADPLLTLYPDYLALSTDPATRQRRYRRMVMDAVDSADHRNGISEPDPVLVGSVAWIPELDVAASGGS